MPIIYIGPHCARRGCDGPVWKDRLCGRCWRLAWFAGKDPHLFAYEPADSWVDERDSVELPWERVDELFAERPADAGPGS